jgi:hypothetical protein
MVISFRERISNLRVMVNFCIEFLW